MVFIFLCLKVQLERDNVLWKNLNEDQVQQSLSNNNQVIICFSFSLSCTSQVVRSKSVTSKSTSSPSVVSNSSSVTSETCQISLAALSPLAVLSPATTRHAPVAMSPTCCICDAASARRLIDRVIHTEFCTKFLTELSAGSIHSGGHDTGGVRAL
jgi:hypothetical protein